MSARTDSVAGTVDWKIAIIFLILGVLFRDQIVDFSGWMIGGTPAATAVAAASSVSPAEPPRRFRPPADPDAPVWRPATITPPAITPPAITPASITPASITPASATGPVEALPPPFSVPPDAQPPAAPSMKLPVVITPTLEYSRNVAVARRERGGHFTFETEVNGVSVPMFFDTGASYVTLRAADAARVGIDVGSLSYSLIGRTANGTAEFAPVTISTLTVGTITRRNVAAMVARPGKLDINLLGQSFLTRVASVNVEGNQVVLRGGEMREDR